MKRDINDLTGRIFDVLIVGGGIHGAAVARECSQHGMSAVLVEKGDFGHATSANSLKIMHGGLRYLQHLNIRRMRDSILARREMLRLAPHYVRPLGCVIPNSGFGVQGNMLMRLALGLNDMIGFDRNNGVDAANRLPAGKILSQRQCKEILPGLADGSCTGASLWYDALAVNSERLTLSMVQAATACGAKAANYTELRTVLLENGKVTGGLVYDLQSGTEYTVQARTVVNAGGPWLDAIQSSTGIAPAGSGWAKAVNIIVKKTLFGPYAVGLRGESNYTDRDSIIRKKGRFFFFVPWRGYTIIGTTYTPFSGEPDAVRANLEDINELVREVNAMYPAAALTRADVTGAHAGLVPMSHALPGSGEDVQLAKESEVVDHGQTDPAVKGFFSIRGVKYTTGLRVAEEAGRKIRLYLKKREGSCIRAAEGAYRENRSTILPNEFRFLAERYGPLAATVYAYVRKNDEKISHDPLLHLGEVDYFMAEEMACTLGDVVFRRCELATAECPEDKVLIRIAKHMGAFFGWSEERIAREIMDVSRRFDFS
ncbi:MAG: FAD-dependent oxidoreductase [Desulfobulbaceae bacterium]|nr:FAD-dependent oxidoreductase [Desulfobulbaceae bacterium]